MIFITPYLKSRIIQVLLIENVTYPARCSLRIKKTVMTLYEYSCKRVGNEGLLKHCYSL